MPRWTWTLCALALGGCAASSDVKQASADVDLALAGLSEAQDEFREVFLRELDATQDAVSDAIVADAVVRVVGTLSAEELDGNLIAISTAMELEREAYLDLTAAVRRTRPRADEPPEDVVDRVLGRKAADLRASARALEEEGSVESAARLRERAEVMKAGAVLLPQHDDLIVLARLQIAKVDVRQGGDDLAAYIEVMRLVHAQVHEWIMTDVTVRGSDVATLVETHAALLGLDGDATDAPSPEPEGGS
jgi:hypothetical protein